MDVEHDEILDIEEPEVERSDTLIRILLSLVFVLGLGVLESVIYLLVAFQLGYTLITQRHPSERVIEAGNRLVAYYYRVLRYLTHAENCKPFPFADFPAPVEPPKPEISE